MAMHIGQEVDFAERGPEPPGSGDARAQPSAHRQRLAWPEATTEELRSYGEQGW